MEEAGDLLEDSWFFGNLLNTKTRTISRSYSDLDSSSCLPHPYPYPSLGSTQEHVKNERKNSSFSSRKQPPVAPPSLNRTPSLPDSIETQYFLMKKPDPGPSFMPSLVGNDEKDVIIKNEPKSSSLSSRKQPPVAPSSPTQRPSLSNSKETRSFQMKKPDKNLTRASSMSSCMVGSDQEDEEDQESEFTLGRLIRQASMNSSHTPNSPRQTSKAMIESMRKKHEIDQEKIIEVRKIERIRSQCRKNNGKNKNGGGAPAIPGGWVDKSSSEDMKAHIKFWARAVASNVRQECS
ncbi:hypothetical protein L1987_49536 [Smallanthus sonchifolius]|uniref:Uncharacterized protein n=1 Tax=Smallanthus sonchifolius TaxID=185202 RepID=A0ACB9FVU1_9ASTR|nr:hypothetical protein L1987_49536 [Smallanthus sonchifolius]